ncbi:MAG: Ig-like domain-containing protein [Patescibacteria group bacterium]|nr:Ig-like domain-containing protein [Patescibacteria group bacterium]
MKKIFYLFFVSISAVFLFICFDYVSGDVINEDYLCNNSSKPYFDDILDQCIGEFQLSTKEAMNMQNIINIANNFNNIKNNTISSFIYLNNDLKNILTEKFDFYYSPNSNISTTTLEGINGVGGISRPDRDAFFRDRYVSYIGLKESIDILSKYNNLGSSIQGLITLLNTTEAYIKNSSLDTSVFIKDIQNSESQLQNYINTINDDINRIYISISNFDIDNPDSFSDFIENSPENKNQFNSRKDEYLAVRDAIIELAITAIQQVEAAYNGHSSITANPIQVYNDGSISTVTVTLKDSLKNPVVGKLVTLQSSSRVDISPSSVTTNVSGIAEFEVSSYDVGYIDLDVITQDEDVVIYGSYLIEVIENPAIKGCEKSGGEWNGKECICPDGFVWDEKLLQCVKSGGGVDEKTCKEGGGEWTGEECKCKEEGFVWSELELQCVNIHDRCQEGGGEWTGEECICPDGFVWDYEQLRCINLSEAGCINSGGEWTGEECKCPDGTFWNEKELLCAQK